MRKIVNGLIGVTIGLMIGGCIIVNAEYCDIPGFNTGIQSGRTKNSISTIIAGIVARDLYGNSDINLKVKKKFWPDAKLTGYTTEDNIETKTNVLLTSAKFKAETDDEGNLKGKVSKSEYNWKVKQVEPNKYKIARFGPKFNATLELEVKEGGVIEGTYHRPGPHFDWDVKGVYDSEGNVEIEVDGPLNLGIVLQGKIAKR